MQVEVEDQFQTRRYDLKRITKLCNPAEKKGDNAMLLAGPNKGDPFPITPATIRNPGTHLVCYRATAAKKRIEQFGCSPLDPSDKGTKIIPKQDKHVGRSRVHINDQFGPKIGDTIKEEELCVPSAKFLLDQ